MRARKEGIAGPGGTQSRPSGIGDRVAGGRRGGAPIGLRLASRPQGDRQGTLARSASAAAWCCWNTGASRITSARSWAFRIAGSRVVCTAPITALW